MTTPTRPQTQSAGPTGIDVCSGPSLTRAERLAQEAARFAPPAPPKLDQPTPRPAAAE